jgi:hypothetical protein
MIKKQFICDNAVFHTSPATTDNPVNDKWIMVRRLDEIQGIVWKEGDKHRFVVYSADEKTNVDNASFHFCCLECLSSFLDSKFWPLQAVAPPTYRSTVIPEEPVNVPMADGVSVLLGDQPDDDIPF